MARGCGRHAHPVSPINWPLDDHVVVRTLTVDDAHTVFALVDTNREHLRPWMPWEPMTKSSADTLVYITHSLESEYDVEGNGIFVDGAFAGGMGMRIDPLNDVGEIGYWIGKAFEGRGLITRATKRFVDYGFDERGLHRIEIKAASTNRRSRAVAERLGFRQEAVLREAGRADPGYLDLVVYGMLAHEWPAA